MKTKFTRQQVIDAWNYHEHLTPLDEYLFWKHYTTGKGRGFFSNVYPDTSFADYLVESKAQTEFERANDI